jgi:hypothetical protein
MTNAITITRKANTVHAPYLPYAAYQSALALATALKGKIGENADKTFKATFNSVKTAEKFVAQWTAEYNANRKVSVEPTKAPTKKPTASKGTNANNFVVVTVDGKEFLVDASALVPTKPTTSSTKKTEAKKASAPKKSTTSSKKAPRKTKGEAFDFGSIKGKTNTDKNKALHATLVGMGLKDSRTPEYMSIWNARPWAK